MKRYEIDDLAIKCLAIACMLAVLGAILAG
jgi:hypothetical protein